MKSKILFVLALLLLSNSLFAETAITRYGKLSTNDDNVLLFNGKKLAPEISGNSSLSILKIYKIGDTDVALVQDNGGTACPAQLHFVQITSARVKATPSFGTCSDLLTIKQTGTSISITMPRMGAKGKATFVYENGLVSETGKPTKK